MVDFREYAIEKYGAVEQTDGSYLDNTGVIQWFNESGDFHNVTGPACIDTDGNAYWRIHGRSFSFDEWCIELNKSDEEKMLLRLQYG
jgi:hypothetical protein